MARKEKKQGRRISGGESKKGSEKRHASQPDAASLANAKDHRRGNIGPSGQGTHRGRERSFRQTTASERPDVSSIGHSQDRKFKNKFLKFMGRLVKRKQKFITRENQKSPPKDDKHPGGS